MPAPFRSISFRFSIILAFSLLISLFLGLMVAVELLGLPGTPYQGKFESSRSAALNDMELVSGLLSQRISDRFATKRRDLAILARSPLFRRAVADATRDGPTAIDHELRSFLLGHQGTEAITLLDPEGRIKGGVGPYSANALGSDITEPPLLAKLVTPGYEEALALRPLANGKIILSIIRQVATPDDPDRLHGLLVAESDLEHILEGLVWSSGNELSPDWECVVATAVGQAVKQISKVRGGTEVVSVFIPATTAFPPVRLALSGIEGRWDGLDNKGAQVLAFHREIKIDAGISLALVFKMDRALALQPAVGDLERHVLLWLLLLVGVIGLCIVVANQISLPVKDLVDVARRIEAGDLTARARGRGNAEIGRLAVVFNGMVHRLEDWNRDLERQVFDRTRELRLLSNRQQAILSAVPDIIMEVDRRMVYTWGNAAGLQFFGPEAIGREFRAYFVGEQGTQDEVSSLFDGQDAPLYVESWQRRQDGEARLLAWWCQSLRDEEGGVIGVLSTARDITGQRRDQEKMVQALREKETLLREIYHRTKNTLQMIQGMLVLQSAGHQDDAAVQGLVAVTEQRIQAISLVHQMLYRSQDLSRVIFRDYVRELLELILRLSGRSNAVRVELSAGGEAFPIDMVIPLGLVLNELATNSLKYAWPAGQTGLISVIMTQPVPGTCRLSYRDDGVGVAPDYSFREGDSLGLKLVFRIIEEQLSGAVSMDGASGYRCEMEFPADTSAGRV